MYNFTPTHTSYNTISIFDTKNHLIPEDEGKIKKHLKCGESVTVKAFLGDSFNKSVEKSEVVLIAFDNDIQKGFPFLFTPTPLNYVVKETDKAICIKYERLMGAMLMPKACFSWIPKSMILVEETDYGYAFFVAEWLAKKNGIPHLFSH